jgi:hypothetical protein
MALPNHMLETEDNWLVVIDNLDLIEQVKGYLPVRDVHKHTLITTRNPNADGIPACGLEVPWLTDKDAAEMLSTLSNITLTSTGPFSLGGVTTRILAVEAMVTVSDFLCPNFTSAWVFPG